MADSGCNARGTPQQMSWHLFVVEQGLPLGTASLRDVHSSSLAILVGVGVGRRLLALL